MLRLAELRHPTLLKEASMLKRPSLLAMLLLSFTLLAPSGQAAPVYGAPINWPPGPIQTADRPPTRSVTERWIIRLTDPPIAQAPGISPSFAALSIGSPAGGKLQLDSPAAQRYRAYLEQQQTSMFAQVQRALPTARLQRRYQIVFNGMSVALPGADAAAIDRLRAMPGVAAVYPEQHYELS